MPTSFHYPRKPPEPLDLGDIRKTQRRVTALLQGPTPRGALGVTFPRKHIPHSFCYVCSRLDPEGRFMGNPYRYLFGRGYMQRCSHVPAAPHPTLLMDDHPNTPVSDYGKTFDTRILNKDELPKANRNTFKVPPTFESVDSEDGRLLPLVSENTFLTTNPTTAKTKRRKTDGRLSLPSLPRDPNYLVAREQDGRHVAVRRPRSQEGSDPEFESQHWEDEPDSKISVDLAWTRPGEAERSGIGPWDESVGNEGGVLRYKHRQQEDWVKYAGYSDPFSGPDKETIQDRSRDKQGRELSFDFKRRGTFSITPPHSRESGTESSPDFVFSRMHSASWCECADADVASLRCRECYQTGGHERWCVSKVGICQKCGKPVRRKHSSSTLQRQRTSSSPSKTFVASRTDLSTFSHNRDECTSRKKDGDQKVRFHDNLNVSFVKEGKKGGILKKDTEMHDLVSDRNKTVFNPSIPRVDPNIHRQAYVLALAEAQVRKFKKNHFVIEHAQKRRYFSYFPLYKHRRYRPAVNPDIGISQEQDGSRKIQLRKAMKHVLGDLKLADYYPGGKKFPATIDQSGHARKQS